MDQAGSAVSDTTPRYSGSGGTNNLPPILFHQVHGDNIRISRDGTVARRIQTCLKGVTFSSRPINVAENVSVKFLVLSNYWSGAISFGFTCNDPNNLRSHLPNYASKDLLYKPGYWMKALTEKCAERDTVLFYVTRAGDVHFGINGEEKGVFFSGVETSGPLWAIIEIYGDSTAIQLVDPRQQLNNPRRNLSTGGDTIPDDPAATEGLILPSLAALNINQQEHQQPQLQQCTTDDATTNDMPRSSFQQPRTIFNRLPFHPTHGSNIRLSKDRCIASRFDTVLRHGYVFTARPIQLGEKVVVKLLATKPLRLGALAFGLTSCDPAIIPVAELSDDTDILLDRPEYWVISKDVANDSHVGDELSFCVTHTGEVQVSKNASTPFVLMHVDQTIPLWAFFDVYGCTQEVRILGSCVEPHHPHTSSGSRNFSPPPRVIDRDPVSATSSSTLDSTVTVQQPVDATATTRGSRNECIICDVRPIDSLFYGCGHMCMCYECAVQQWRDMGGGHCPICKTVIGNVIRAHRV